MTRAVPRIADRPAAADEPQAGRLLFGVFMLALLCLLTAPFFVDPTAHGAPKPADGAVSYRGWGPLDRPVQLAGQWMLDWRLPGAAGSVPVAVPGLWTGAAGPDGKPLPAQGRATYRLLIRDLPAGRYRLYVPAIFGANRVSIGGEVVSRRGTLGDDFASTRYQVRAHDIVFEANGRDVPVAIEIAAFRHRDNGFDLAPVFGLAEPMQFWSALRWGQEFLFHTALVLLGIYGLVVFLFRPTDRASLYFALSCFLFLPTSAALGHDNLLMMAFPGLSLGGMLALMYLPAELALGFFLAYAHALFPAESPRFAYRALLGAVAVLLGVQAASFLVGDTLIASRVNLGLLPVMLAVFSYIVFVLVRAVANRRDGAVVFLLGIAVFFASILVLAVVAYGVLPSDKVIGLDFTAYGVLVLLFSHVIILAERWSLAIDSAERINDDLRRLLDVNLAITSEIQLEALLRKILNVTSKLLHADRSSLLLYDPEREELWSMVAEGMESGEIRFSADEGLAGYALRTGETVNVLDAYSDPRFIRRMDELTGYRTHSILTMPVTARDGRRLGVMQALNRHGSGAFTEEDIARMRAFAAQAAVAIDNATLFKEVVSARNYNESILRSMSSGVVTLDREGRVAKLNPAACRILRVEEARLTGAPARDLLAAANPWLLSEVEEVRAGGGPRTLLDIDMRTGGRGKVSVNVSVVPLLVEDEPVGLLLLIEDISEGKRLQGAMRRFMPQKVVEQVLEREDDLLFGTACEASVLFADIRNFSSIAETLKPRETVDMLNEVFTELFEAVAANDGMLDKFMGDAVMAVYGAPLSTGRDPQNAVASAVQMMRLVAALNERRRKRRQAEIRLGVGVATGEVVAGTIGSPKRMDYTVIGDSVNLAARLQTFTKHYKVNIVIDEATAAAVGKTHDLRELDVIRVRGRSRPEKIFQVLANGVNGAEGVLDAYARGRELLARRAWTEAAAAFAAAVAEDPDDRPAALMLERARILASAPPAEDWDGVWRFPEAA